jgi:hypothetical protein
MSNLKRKIGLGLVGLLLMIGGLQVTTTRPASAYADGCSGWGSVPYLSIPTGYMCFEVWGSISSQRATWRTASLCNWRIDWIAYDASGRQWWRSNGPTHYGCTWISGGRSRGAGYVPKYGRMCARVYSHNTWLAGVCHTIY